jgi:hypothetical protein
MLYTPCLQCMIHSCNFLCVINMSMSFDNQHQAPSLTCSRHSHLSFPFAYPQPHTTGATHPPAMSWMNQWISGDGEQPVGPLAPNAVKQRKPTKLQSTTPPLDSPIVDAEETPPGSPYGNFPMDDKYPRVADPAKLSEGRTVSTKPSNRPFLACVYIPRRHSIIISS